MNFLSKHYEKIVLALFLLVFVFSLVYLIVVFSKSTEITEEDLMVRPEGSDYEKIFDSEGKENTSEDEKAKYAALKDLEDETAWRKSAIRDKNDDTFTDLLIPFVAARCQGCHKIIPSISYDKKKCPLCGCVLGAIKIKKIQTGGDGDEDGMPDLYEASNGLDIQDPGDKWSDADEDGFPNFTEFKAETKAGNAKSHPPLADRLRLAGFKRKKLNIKFVNVVTYNSKIKSKWIVQLKLKNKRNQWRDSFKRIGDNLTLDKKGLEVYELKDVIYKMEERFNKNLGRPMPTNVSELVLQNAMDKSDKAIISNIGKSVYANKVVIIFFDTYTEKKYLVKEGGTFTLGTVSTGRETYTVLSLNIKKKIAVIQNTNGVKFTIDKKSKLQVILEASDVDKSKIRDRGTPDIMGDPRMNNTRGGRSSRKRKPSRNVPFDPMMPPR